MSVFSQISEEIKTSDKNNNTLTKDGKNYDWNNSCYGRQWMASINKKIYRWKININKSKGCRFAIGMVSNLHHQKTNKGFGAIGDKHSYWINIRRGSVYINGNVHHTIGQLAVEGDVLTFIYNASNSKLEYIVNNMKTTKTLIENIETVPNLKYRLALSISCNGDTVSFDDDDNDYDEQKNDEYADNKMMENTSEIKKYQQQMLQFQGLVQSLENENKSLKNINDQSFQTIGNLQSKIRSLEKDNNEKTSQIDRLNNKISSLEDEKKETEMTVNELREEIKRLKSANINTDNWRDWDYQEVVCWIISLDPTIYGQYEEKLVDSLKDESVNGEALSIIDISDIKRWGIKNIFHSKTLLKHIQTLIANKKAKNNESTAMMNEGANATPTAYM